MKRINRISFGLLFVSILLFSCGKTTTSKVTNKWEVSNFSIVEDDQNSVLSSSSQTTLSGDNQSFTCYSDGELMYNAVIDKNILTISKNGSYTQQLEYHYSYYVDEETQESYSYSMDIKGVWSFLEKNRTGDFKKNEKIQFLMTEIHLSGTEDMETYHYSTSFENDDTYGIILPFYENYMSSTIWSVEKSTAKELTLNATQGSRRDFIYDGAASYDLDKIATTMTLVKKK